MPALSPNRVRPKVRGSASQRRPPYATSARVAFDVFDLGVMDQVRQRLTSMESSLDVLRSGGHLALPEEEADSRTQKSGGVTDGTSPKSGDPKTGVSPKPSSEQTKRSPGKKGSAAGDQVYVFKSRVTARRTDSKTGQVSLLVSWVPDGM